jgi:hypothetical protein
MRRARLPVAFDDTRRRLRRRHIGLLIRGTTQNTTTNHLFACDALRTPVRRYGGALSSVRTDVLSAVPIRSLMARRTKVD